MNNIVYSLKDVRLILKKQRPSKVCIVTSTTLKKKLEWAIKELNIPSVNIILLPDGEKAKEWSELKFLLKKFIELNLDRKSIVLALGGGSIGDIVGFATAIYLRGIQFIQIPTTLLAQVDSAHGGKTGVNFLKYKNQIGSFHMPLGIVIDKRFILSLSTEQVIDGLGEIIKAGFIKDSTILDLLKKETIHTLQTSKHLSSIIEKSIKVKQYYIEKDFKDTGERQILNVGHTLGHSIELKYGISHGKAVIIGMLQEMAWTESIKLTSKGVYKELTELIESLGIKLDSTIKADWNMILHDKKVQGQKIDFPVVSQSGKAKIIKLNLKKLEQSIQ